MLLLTTLVQGASCIIAAALVFTAAIGIAPRALRTSVYHCTLVCCTCHGWWSAAIIHTDVCHPTLPIILLAYKKLASRACCFLPRS